MIRTVLEESRRSAGGGAALAAALREAGVGPDTGAYSESAVSNWIKGRTRPPADVVLAAASVFGVPLDPLLTHHPGSSDPPTTPPASADVTKLRADLTQLEQLVYRSLGISPRLDDLKDVVAVYGTRAEAASREPLLRVIAGAEHVDAMGLSLNGIAQTISGITLAELIEGGLTLRALLLNPDGRATRDREAEESMPEGHLAEITRTNLGALNRIRGSLTNEAKGRLQLRTYDDTLRFNLLIADGRRCLVQCYLPRTRGVDSPTLVIDHRDDQPHGLFPVFLDLFATTWERAEPC